MGNTEEGRVSSGMHACVLVGARSFQGSNDAMHRQARRPAAESTLRAIAFCAALSLAFGCGDDPSDPNVPGGGGTYVLDPELFEAAVAPVLTAQGCDAAGDCHGGGIRGTYELSPTSAKNLDFDFGQSVLQVDGYNPTMSPLLLKPLAEATGGSPHGVTAFADTDDPGYLAILDWILQGEFR